MGLSSSLLGRAALAACVVAAAALAALPAGAHLLEPRKDLEGFIRRADVIVRARVAKATVAADPKVGALPLVTELAVEKAYRGGAVGASFVLLGRDDHAPKYREGQRLVVFASGRPGLEARYGGEQNKGEELFVGDGDEGAWDAFFAVAERVDRAGPPILGNAEYRAALFAALRAPAMALREHALRRVALWTAAPSIPRAEIDALLAAAGDRALPDRFRIGVLGAALNHLGAAELRALASAPGERSALRGALLDGWAARAIAKGAKAGDKEAAAASAAEALGDGDADLRLYAAAALGRLGDSRGLQALRAGLSDTDLRRRRIAIRGLGRLHRAHLPEARALLRAARAKEGDPRARRWIDEALPARDRKAPPPPSYPAILWIGVGLGAAVLVTLALWLAFAARRRSRTRA